MSSQGQGQNNSSSNNFNSSQETQVTIVTGHSPFTYGDGPIMGGQSYRDAISGKKSQQATQVPTPQNTNSQDK